MSVQTEVMAQLREGMKPTWLDRQISRWSPGWGLSRLQARATMAVVGGKAWTGARRDLPELKNWNPIATSPDDEQRYDRPYLLSRATDLERNDALAGGAVAEIVLSVVGTGLSLQPEPMRKVLGWTQDQAVEWAEEVKGRFNLWAQDPRECDIRRRRNFYQAQALSYRTVASRGDCYVLLPRLRHPGTTWSLKFQLIEGDRLMTPVGMAETNLLSQGVQTDDNGGVVKYWFAKKHPSTAMACLSKDDFTPVDAWGANGRRLVLPMLHEHRLDLRRGYPLLAPVITVLKQMSRLSDAELAAAVVTSFFAVVIEKNSASGPGPLGGAVKKDDQGAGFMELGHAIVAELAPGEKITNVAPTRPNGAFDPFWNSLVGQVSMRLQIPPEVLLKKFSTSYTAARGALQQYWKFVLVERENLLAPDFCQPLYEAWLDEEVSSGRIKAPGYFASPLLRSAYCNAHWVGDNPPIMDPVKEVLAAQEMVDYGFSTYSEQTMRLTGGDFEANHERLTREVRMRKEAGLTPAPKAPAAKPAVAAEEVDPAADPTEDPNADSGAPGGKP